MKNRLQIPARSLRVRLSIGMALVLMLVEAFRWNIIDSLTPFVAGPLLAFVWSIAWISAIYFAIDAKYRRREPAHALVPLAILIGAVIVATFVPFTQLWLRANFELKREARQQVVRSVLSGELRPNVKHNGYLIKLPDGAGLSMGGDEIVVDGPPGQTSILFYTFRGFLGAYSGFVWVPHGRRPEQFRDAGEPGTEIVQFDQNWYYIGHR